MSIFGRNKKRVLVAILFLPLLLLLSAGAAPTTASANDDHMLPDKIIIDWIDFIKFNGIMYLGTTQEHPPTQSDLGAHFATVKFMVAGNVDDPSYKVKDGDAAFWTRGTKVYSVKGYEESFRLAIPGSSGIRLYEAFQNSHARKGGDLLDIGGKVRSIDILSNEDGTTVLGTIKNDEQVERLVGFVLSAPVQQNIQPEDQLLYFIAFHLIDGTTVSRPYWPAGVLGSGIMTPQKFRDAIIEALPHK